MKTYSPRKVLTYWNGVPLSGYGPDTFIKVSRAADSFEKDVGADGEVARTASADRSGTIEITLQSVSESNDLLSDSVLRDELTQASTGSFFLTDASGRTVLSAPEAWVKKPTDVEFAASKGTRTWTIETGNLVIENIGGN